MISMSNPRTAPEVHDGSTSTIFHNLQFGYNSELSKVKTSEFLEHSKHVVEIIEKMGKMFAPLKYDMNGNINKITAMYKKDEVAHQYLEDMVLTEQAAGGLTTIDALQWLRRGLHFLAKFFDCILEDVDQGGNQQTLVPFLKIAYETVLQRYHGWMGGQLFNIMCRFAPNRKELYKILASTHTYNEEHVVAGMRVFKTNLLICINHLVKFYRDYNLENEAVV
ncbi:hypothetical protein AMK59_8091 [Oryctes borbonicus]|uniref:Glycolipid transfer protein domain-containing protein n=1 Tax=Oryctes borbonicus TaxID=1629725 RepID=A0A0T6B0C1_9SCAR|nr:hypothetical protein AMK59_8091 [Oryctes borbonicus]